MWVVKLGGSLQFSEQLPMWLSAVTEHGSGSGVIVPGGGAFADQVRRSQQHWYFDDRTAHHMALHAMEQYGLMLHGINKNLDVARSLGEISAILKAGRVAIWLPTDMVMQNREIVASWDVSADSLSAWLASSLQAQRLFLVKSVELGAGLHSIEGLIQRGLLDRAFNQLSTGLGCDVVWLHRDQHTHFGSILDGERLSMARLCAGNFRAIA
jgi:aspartokinase-like uncharacterized kinase